MPSVSPKGQEVTKYVRLKNHEDGTDISDTLHRKSTIPTHCLRDGCQGAVIAFKDQIQSNDRLKPYENLLAEAEDLITQYYEHKHLANSSQHTLRWQEVKESIEEHGTYEIEYDELVFGARTAWRNASRCIGRIQWANLEILDGRQCKTAEDVFEACCKHLEFATNDGNIRSTITLFKQRIGSPENDFRIWNHQLIRYAGYRQPDGSIIGDPAEEGFTKVCEILGWKGEGTQFDVLPLVISAAGEDPKLFDIPKYLIMEVPLIHPKFKWFQGLGLKWYAVPAISCIMLDVGGLQFPAAPFNGWYMQSEIGRNFCESNRYNIIPVIAKMMGLDTNSNYTLWKDEAFVEINKAILYSYKEAGATIIDHHSASDSFMSHMANEQKIRRGCPADWVWVVPPIGGSLCKVWHQEMLNYHLRPSYEYMSDAWPTHVWNDHQMELKFNLASARKLQKFKSCGIVILFSTILAQRAKNQRPSALILYATETGKSERYARQTNNVFQRSFNSRIQCMDTYCAADLLHENLVLIVTSTFGNGDPPSNGVTFYAGVQELVDNKKCLLKAKYAVFALGSSAYLNFCKFGKNLDKKLKALKAERVADVATGDELQGEAEMFREWLSNVYMKSCNRFNIQRNENADVEVVSEEDQWSPEKYKIVEINQSQDKVSGLSLIHRHQVIEVDVLSKSDLHKTTPDDEDVSILMHLRLDDGITYQPGDHLALFPQNNIEMVNKILAKLDCDVNMDHPVQIKPATSPTPSANSKNSSKSNIKAKVITHKNRQLPACSLREALVGYLDITTPPTPEFLKCLSLVATNKSEKNILKRLAKGEREYTRWRQLKQPALIDILQEFPSVTLQPTLIMTELPLLQARLYSISSSQAVSPGEVSITFSMVNYNIPGSKRPNRNGVATSYMRTIPKGTKIPIYIKPAPDFHLPPDPTMPLIFLATGCGIGPIRSFWQELEKTLGDKQEKLMLQICGDEYDTTLIYGCRTRERYLFKDEIERAKSTGVLQNTLVAYSREPDQKKKYVQHLLEEHGEQMVEKIVTRKAHIYVCGGVQLAEDVQNSVATILRKFKGFSAEKAETYIDVMKKTRRYHEDVFGILRNKCNFHADDEPGANWPGNGQSGGGTPSKTCTIL